MADDVLQMPLQFLKGVGPRKAADLKKAGLHTVEDLLFRFPRRYEDRSRLQTIISLKPGQTAAVSGVVLSAGLAHTRRPGFRLFSALIQDDSGQVQAVWPNQAFLKDVIRSHQRIVLFGKVEIWGSRGLQITDPEFEIIKDETDGIRDPGSGNREPETLHTGRIVPVYERTGSVTPNMQRRFVWQALEQLPPQPFDPVPDEILKQERWPSRREALWQAHFPDPDTPIDALNAFATPAQRRLIFEDFFVFQSGLALRRHENAQVRKRLVCTVDDRIRQSARAVLPSRRTCRMLSPCAMLPCRIFPVAILPRNLSYASDTVSICRGNSFSAAGSPRFRLASLPLRRSGSGEAGGGTCARMASSSGVTSCIASRDGSTPAFPCTATA